MDHFEHSGLTFEVTDTGPADGEAVVLLHGFPQQPASFAAVVPQLNAAGLRTLVPTQRGYTPGARPTGRRDYRTAATVADVIALLDAAGVERARVVGHDWGGAQAWGAAAWHPDRVSALIVLSTPHPAAMMKAFRTSRQALMSWYMALFQLPALPELLAARTLARTLRSSGLPAEQVTAYAAAMQDPAALTGALNWYRGLPFSSEPLGRIRVPTRYVWGRRDFALGRRAAELTGDYVTGPYEFCELDAGHWLPERRPEAVADAILQPIKG